MAQGLAAFRKYIPADLVRRLISDGNGARLGGAVRPMSVMFIDLAGFTGMSERLGDRIIPLLSRYLDVVSAQIQDGGGTIDKFIGDAVMAFWGAPSPNPDHASIAAAPRWPAARGGEAGLTDDRGEKVKIRIGINSGDMLVGNIGSEVRLNYTVIGDAVNIASRLESTNKSYGSTIIIGPETRRLAGDRIVVRELDRLAVYWPRRRPANLRVARHGRRVRRPARLGRGLRGRPRRVAHGRFRRRDRPFRAGAERQAARRGVIPDDRALQAPDENPTAEGWDGTTVARTK